MKRNLFESQAVIDEYFPDMSAGDLVLDPDGQSNSGKSGRGVRMHERPTRPELTEAEVQKFLRAYGGEQLYKYGDTVPHLDGAELFGDDAPITWDYGCGRGERLIELAKRNPDQYFVGVDIHMTSLKFGARAAADALLGDNIRFIKADCGLLVPYIPDGSSNAAAVMFPAPVPKNNGTFKGIPTPEFSDQVHRTLVGVGAPFEFASDSAPYFNHRMRQIGARGLYSLAPDEFTIGFDNSANPTRYQKVWEQKEIPTHHAILRKA